MISTTTTIQRQLGILSRTPKRFLAAQNEADLREALGVCLRGLFRNLLRFELYTRDLTGSLSPSLQLGEGQLGNGHRLLLHLRSRLRTRGRDGSELTEAQAVPDSLGTKRGSLMSAPLRDADETLGIVVVEAGHGAPDFSPFDLDIFEGVAALVSLALQRLRAKETEFAQVRIERDLKAASVVQRSLMTGELPAGIGVTSHAEYLPAFDVGGDFFDLVHAGEGRVRAVIGDVSGKGVAAALVMSRVLSELRHRLEGDLAPAAVLAEVNAVMSTDDSETFATASCLTLDARARTLEVASAGHIPLIVRRTTGQVFTFGSPSGTPLGMIESDYEGERLSLDPGDIVLMMTDGLVEALDRPSDRMGLQLLLGLIKYAPHAPRAIIESCLEAVRKMKGTNPMDDVTLVALCLDQS